jgi:citrate lyase subunit gamma (acyl carrier protein)
VKIAQAGTLESSDAVITLVPGATGSGVKIQIESNVLAQYGEAIGAVIAATLAEQSLDDVLIKVVDRGALDCTIKARLLTVIERAQVPEKRA